MRGYVRVCVRMDMQVYYSLYVFVRVFNQADEMRIFALLNNFI